jgi:hypothetical protein
MSVNNTAKIGTMISFDNDDFYFVQILKRRKDNIDLERDMIVINNYYIESVEHYIKTIPHIIELCIMENARAYIRLNKRNYKKLGSHMVKRVVDIVFSENSNSLKGVFNSIAGEFHSDTDKKWVIDIDNDKEVQYSELLEEATRLQKETGRDPMAEIFPTKNGIHLITRPFNLQKFKEKFPTIDVHKDANTILYCP